MKRGVILVLAIAVLTAIGAFAGLKLAPHKAPPQTSFVPVSVDEGTPKLEDRKYNSARKVILSLGWKPAPGPCLPGADLGCADYPEMDFCSGLAPGNCRFVFTKANSCLIVTATGNDEGPGDTIVEDVAFRRGACTKDVDPNNPVKADKGLKLDGLAK